tara:strand:+ start:263 stop:493 length:231 start_codon:yes stop_codon:yes gene_type:complete
MKGAQTMGKERKKMRKCGMYYYSYIPMMYKLGREKELDRSDRLWFKKNYKQGTDPGDFVRITEKTNVNIFKGKNNG